MLTQLRHKIWKKANTLTHFIPPPPNVGKAFVRRKVLVLHAHPVPTSFSVALSNSTVSGLQKSGHEVRLKRLYNIGNKDECYNGSSFSATLTKEERSRYYDEDRVQFRMKMELDKIPNLEPDIREAIDDVGWCDSIVFVFPTWWFNFPAAMKGFFDRVLLPGTAFKFPSAAAATPSMTNVKGDTNTTGSTGLVGLLTNINKIGVVTTSGSSRAVTMYAGRGPSLFMSKGLRALCAPGCQLSWLQMYELSSKTDMERKCFLSTVESAYEKF